MCLKDILGPHITVPGIGRLGIKADIHMNLQSLYYK